MSKKILVIGAGGHALEILDLIKNSYQEVTFFDNLSKESNIIHGSYRVLNSFEQVRNYLQCENRNVYILPMGTRACM